MVNIAGNYQLVENKNFYQYLMAMGIPEDKAKKVENIKGTAEVTVDGNQVTIVHEPPQGVNKTYVIGQEVDENFAENTIFKSTTTLDDNILKVSSTKDGKPAGTKTFTFSDSGVEIVFTTPKDGKTFSATRTYKRI